MPKDEAQAAPGAGARARGNGLHWGRWIVGSLVLGLVVVAGYGTFLVDQFQHAIYHPLPPARPTPGLPAGPPPVPALLPPTVIALGIRRPPAPAAPPRPSPSPAASAPAAPTAILPATRINILVLGTDKRPDLQETAARSDTLILLSVDPHWQTAGILSVPRDLQVPIPGYGLQKINAAYFFGEYAHLPGGGAGLALTTVSQYFGVPIPYYVAINFAGFEKVIDLVGGIDVAVPAAIDDPLYPGPNNSYMHVHFDAGCQHLDGARALEYARTRHSDSDFGRNRRQQQVIQAVRTRVLALDMLPRYAQLLSQLGNTLETNIAPAQQVAFAQLAAQLPANNLYTAQIESTLVQEIAGTSNLALQTDQAQPLLDWFFGRGLYAGQKPGSGRPVGVAAPSPGASVPGRCP